MDSDLLLTNATAYTMDAEAPVARQILIRGERIAGVSAEVDGFSHGRRIDLRGLTFVPGFTDAHIHFEQYALTIGEVDVEVPMLDEALSRIRERVETAEPGEWIRGRGWHRGGWGLAGFPTAAQLDAVAPQNPVAIGAKSGHGLWVNSSALQRAGIDAQTPDPDGGEIVRDSGGSPSGCLLESAMEILHRAVPQPSTTDSIHALPDAFRRAWQVGLTGVHDLCGARAIAAYQDLMAAGELGLRVVAYPPVEQLQHLAVLGIRRGFGSHWLTLGGVKAFIDGALGTRTAAMLEPYEGETEALGITMATQAETLDWFKEAEVARQAVAVHAIGDRACRWIINAAETVLQGQPSPLRHRVEHAQLLHPDDFARMAKLGLVASMQPIHATSDMEMAEAHWGHRSACSYAWRTMLNAGVPLAFGSDCPVEPLDPLLGIHAAVTRRRRDGSPGPDGWRPEQRLTVPEAVRAHTLGAAYAAHQEEHLGSIAPGKLADLVVLSDDIFTIDPMAIADVRVLGTMIGGKWAYVDETLQAE